MAVSRTMQKDFVPGSSRGPRSAHTLALQVRKATDRQRAIGARLRELRGPRPQPVVAEAIGVTLRAYQSWEHGDSGIAWRNLHALAEYHGVSENYILYGEQKPKGAETQMDRIEAKLDQLLAQAPEGPAVPNDWPPERLRELGDAFQLLVEAAEAVAQEREPDEQAEGA